MLLFLLPLTGLIVSGQAPNPSPAMPYCNSNLQRFIFTPCDPSTQQMLSVTYFNESCRELYTTPKLRSPIAVPCVRLCGSGTYYAPTAWGGACASCSAGTSSNSGGRIINTFDDIPDGFVTYCSPKPCRVWSPDTLGGMLTSGNQTGLRSSTDPYWPPDESVRVELVTIIDVINLQNGGKFMCDYRVESEEYFDGLQVFVNGTLYIPEANKANPGYDQRFLLSGVHLGWRRLVLALPFGSTEVRLVYAKDHDQMSAQSPDSFGADRAFIRDIVIEGVQMFAPTCTPCAPGTFARYPGSMSCDLCPANTYSSRGSTSCTPCNKTSWSPPGSVICHPMDPCQPSDYVAVYSPCNPVTRTRTFSWTLPSTAHCVPQRAPPAAGSQPCDVCMPGAAWNNVTSQCDACPSGERRNADGSCEACGQGYAAVPSIEFDGFDRFGTTLDSQFFIMKCSGQCVGCPAGNFTCVTPTGFSLASISAPNSPSGTLVGIRSDGGNGPQFTSTLRYPFVSSTSGWFEIQYFFQHSASGRILQQSSLEAEVRFDRDFVVPLRAASTASNPSTLRHTFDAGGSHIIEVAVSLNARTVPLDEVSLFITYFKVHGDSRGAATACTMCDPGYYCPARASAMVPCEPGYFTPRFGASSCTSCRDGYFADRPASFWCAACPPGTTSEPTHRRCVPSCTRNVTVGNLKFDLSSLADLYYGPVLIPGYLPQPEQLADATEVPRYYLSFCHYVNHNGSSTICEQRRDGSIDPSYACQRLSDSRAYSTGVNPGYALNRDGQLTFGLTGGDVCVRGGAHRSTNVTMICDSNTPPQGTLQFVQEEPHCNFVFTFRGPQACTICLESDYERYESPCDAAGKMLVKYVRKPGSESCVGGFIPPAPTNVTCIRCVPAFYDSSWSKCDAGLRYVLFTLKPEYSGCSEDGSAIRQLEQQYEAANKPLNRTCRSMEISFGANQFTAALGLVLIVVAGLVAAVFVIRSRYTRLQYAYSTLAQANANGGWEMNELPPDGNGGTPRSSGNGAAHDEGATQTRKTGPETVPQMEDP